MATNPLGRRAPSINVAAAVSAVKAVDAQFWRLHAKWRTLEDAFENYPGYPDEDPVAERMLDEASAARDAMFQCGVWTAAALGAKLAACNEGGASSVIDMRLRPGFTVFDVIEWDCERIAKREMGLSAPGNSC